MALMLAEAALTTPKVRGLMLFDDRCRFDAIYYLLYANIITQQLSFQL